MSLWHVRIALAQPASVVNYIFSYYAQYTTR